MIHIRRKAITTKGKCKEIIDTSSAEYTKFDTYVFTRIKMPSFLVMSTIFLVPFVLSGYADSEILSSSLFVLVCTIGSLAYSHNSKKKSFDYTKMLKYTIKHSSKTSDLLTKVEKVKARNVKSVKFTFRIIKFCIFLLVIGPIENKIQDLFNWPNNLKKWPLFLVILIALIFLVLITYLLIYYPLRWGSDAYHWFQNKLNNWIDQGLFVKDFVLYTATIEALKAQNEKASASRNNTRI